MYPFAKGCFFCEVLCKNSNNELLQSKLQKGIKKINVLYTQAVQSDRIKKIAKNKICQYSVTKQLLLLSMLECIIFLIYLCISHIYIYIYAHIYICPSEQAMQPFYQSVFLYIRVYTIQYTLVSMRVSSFISFVCSWHD